MSACAEHRYSALVFVDHGVLDQWTQLKVVKGDHDAKKTRQTPHLLVTKDRLGDSRGNCCWLLAAIIERDEAVLATAE